MPRPAYRFPAPQALPDWMLAVDLTHDAVVRAGTDQPWIPQAVAQETTGQRVDRWVAEQSFARALTALIAALALLALVLAIGEVRSGKPPSPRTPPSTKSRR